MMREKRERCGRKEIKMERCGRKEIKDGGAGRGLLTERVAKSVSIQSRASDRRNLHPVNRNESFTIVNLVSKRHAMA